MNLTFFANSLWQKLCKRKWQKFASSAGDLQTVQSSYLQSLLQENQKCCFGLDHSLAKISSLEEFRKQIPILSYEDYASYVEQIRAGQEKVLSVSPVKKISFSSGTTSASKYLLLTKRLQQEFDGSISAWIYGLFQRFPQLRKGKAYFSISPVFSQGLSSDKRYGFAKDSQYFGFWSAQLLSLVLAVPETANLFADSNSFYYYTSLSLLLTEDLALISIWNPSFLLLLLEYIDSNREQLCRSIVDKRVVFSLHAGLEKDLLNRLYRFSNRRNLLALLQGDRLDYGKVWPSLAVISMWQDGFANRFVEQIRSQFPGVFLEAKGLVATEGFVSFPWYDKGDVLFPLAYTSHFFEFVDVESQDVFFPWEVKQDGIYEVILTTGGGLYRYRLQDTVQIYGFWRQLPLIRFLGKAGVVVDMTGEKLQEDFAKDCMQASFRHLGLSVEFYFLAAVVEQSERCYKLFCFSPGSILSSQLLLQDLEKRLCANFHYAYSRKMGQLAALRIEILNSDYLQWYMKTKAERGIMGTVKFLYLEKPGVFS
ncbi:MAG: GH3 auxin-responsive promoter family protein [Spirochaetota bacterium]